MERNYLHEFAVSLRSLIAGVSIRLVVVDPTALTLGKAGRYQQEGSGVAGPRIHLYLSQASPSSGTTVPGGRARQQYKPDRGKKTKGLG